HLLCYGVVGSGLTTTLSSLALSIAATHSPADLHLYVVDMGAGDLAPLAALPHCGAVVRASERERQVRLIRRLQTVLEERRRGVSGPEVVVLIDGLEALRSVFDEPAGYGLLDALDGVIADGVDGGLRV